MAAGPDGVHCADPGPDRRVLLARAAPATGARMVAHKQRRRLGNGRLLRRLHGERAAPRHANRPCRPQAHLSPRRRPHDRRSPAVCRRSRRLLVRVGVPRADRHRLGRDVHDRPQVACGPGRCPNDVARDRRPCRQHRYLWRAVICHGRPAGRTFRMALGVPRGGAQRARCLGHDRGGRPTPTAGNIETRRRRPPL